jgi:hypothetical protein
MASRIHSRIPAALAQKQKYHQTMNTKIDLKSALLGLCIGLVAVLAIGAGEGESRPVGRYQSSAGGELLLIVDSVTGRAWCVRPGGTSISGSPGGFFEKKVDN